MTIMVLIVNPCPNSVCYSLFSGSGSSSFQILIDLSLEPDAIKLLLKYTRVITNYLWSSNVIKHEKMFFLVLIYQILIVLSIEPEATLSF